MTKRPKLKVYKKFLSKGHAWWYPGGILKRTGARVRKELFPIAAASCLGETEGDGHCRTPPKIKHVGGGANSQFSEPLMGGGGVYQFYRCRCGKTERKSACEKKGKLYKLFNEG